MLDAEWLQELRSRCRDRATFEQVQALLQDEPLDAEAIRLKSEGEQEQNSRPDRAQLPKSRPDASNAARIAVSEPQDYRYFIRTIEHIRQNLEHSAIIQTAVQAVLDYLGCDRVLIAQFETPLSGQFLAEALVDAVVDPNNFLANPEIRPACAEAESSPLTFTVNMELATVRDRQTSALECELSHRLGAYGVQSLAAAPILCNDVSWGVLVACYHTPQPIARRIQELLQQFSLSIGNALDHANLLEQTRVQARKLAQTLRKLQQTQAQLIQNEKMASLGQLVAGIAHEINNPVSFIHGNLGHIYDYSQDLIATIEAYQAQFADAPDPIAQQSQDRDIDFIRQDLPRLVASMHNGTARIRQIVQSLRTFSRLDESASKTIDIHSGIESVILLLRQRLSATPQRCEIEIQRKYAALPPIHCYPAALNQVFMNLLNNAIDALAKCTDRVPTISVTTTRPNDKTIAIAIGDNGTGILPEYQPRIFDPFFTTKPPGKGTGLGLSVSYQIVVDTHGGELTCESVPNQGSTLTIELPVQGDLVN